MKLCECGCGEKVAGPSHKKFVNQTHLTRRWRKENPGKQRQYTIRWREENPEKAYLVAVRGNIKRKRQRLMEGMDVI